MPWWNAGATVTAFDPEGMENVKKLIGDKINYAKDEYEALKGADALIICHRVGLVPHARFRQGGRTVEGEDRVRRSEPL
jgi:UDP-glucose 6-dehydrogenase